MLLSNGLFIPDHEQNTALRVGNSILSEICQINEIRRLIEDDYGYRTGVPFGSRNSEITRDAQLSHSRAKYLLLVSCVLIVARCYSVLGLTTEATYVPCFLLLEVQGIISTLINVKLYRETS